MLIAGNAVGLANPHRFLDPYAVIFAKFMSHCILLPTSRKPTVMQGQCEGLCVARSLTNGTCHGHQPQWNDIAPGLRGTFLTHPPLVKMERHGRRERVAGEHPTRPRDSREHPSSSRHHKFHKPSNGQSRSYKGVPKTESHRDGAHAKLPKETLAGPLNGDDDYVRRWLAHTDNLTNQDVEPLRRRETSSRYEQEKGTHIAHVKPKNRLDPQETEEALPPIRKRKHASSSDSSILAVPIRSKSQQIDRGKKEARTRKSQEKESPRKKQRIESPESSSSDPFTDESPPKETFERRARYKTREDKYEPKTEDKRAKKDGTERKSRRKKEKKSDRRKTARKSGEELMQNFSSKSIGQERLTVRPTQGLGLFNNGRASSPARRRGLSDLAFSEMNFLQHSNRHPQVEQKTKTSSKSREKEKRKASRAQEEITEFFRPSRKPLEETHPNKEDRRKTSSSKPTEKRSVNIKQVEQENQQQSHDDIRSLDPRERPFIGLRHTSSERLSTYCIDSPAITDPRKGHESASKASEKATTYVSWSETQLSPSASSRRPTTIDGRRVSPTPESVWRLIEKTGIFRDTGVERTSALRRDERPSSRLDRTKVASHGSESAHYGQVRSSTSPKRTSPEVRHNHLLDPRFQKQRPTSASYRGRRRSPSAEESRPLSSKPGDAENSQNPQEVGNIQRRIVVEHFDPEHGWHETPNPLSRCASRTSDPPRESRSTPIDRHELAKAARIKRLATTLPISRYPAEEKEQEKFQHGDQETTRTTVVRSTEHKASMLVDKTAFSTENNPAGVRTHHPDTEQISGKENTSQQVDSEDGQEFASNSGYELHEFGERRERFGQQSPQQSSTADAPQETDFVQNVCSSTYLGLPLRGSWRPDQQHQSRVMSDQRPHFLHQLQQEALMNYDTVPEYTEVSQYELYDIPEEEEPASMHDEYQGEMSYGYHEAYVAKDPVNSHYYDHLNDAGAGDTDHGGVNEFGMEYHPEYNTCNEPGSQYPPAGSGQRDIYEYDAIVEEFIDQELEMPFHPEEQAGHEFYDLGQYGHMEGFWQLQRQY
ncbi:uncharacterized protein PAC_00369 [Phialocephala subalpina]|uniref:Uncharacterized protein n=1 Tax=Phialocephala subalpina TaxID=576137 RepID=A0A1L7WCJ7_9HELO|nr:uncharacterized protein PAC_00369 [Phialocephala subalpina]